MDVARFDRLTRALAARRFSRRFALRTTAAGLVAVLTARGRPSSAQEATPSSTAVAGGATLFVQTAIAGTFRSNPAAGMSATPEAVGTPAPPTRRGAYLLTLEGHAGETIGFSDRPQRSFGEVRTTTFFAAMGFTPDNPPNAALVADTAEQDDDVLLLELLNPAYDEPTKTLTYEADILQRYEGELLTPLATTQDQVIAERFGSASLFIDDCPDSVNCFGAFWIPVGPIPGGPVSTCWSWSSLSCEVCDDPILGYQIYADLCNKTYSACQDECSISPYSP